VRVVGAPFVGFLERDNNGAVTSTIAELEVETAAGDVVRLGQFLDGTTLLLLPRYYG
jgi:hypothetical protein